MTLSRAALATRDLIQTQANAISETDPVQHFLQIVNESTKKKVARIYYDSSADLPTAELPLQGMVATVYFESLLNASSVLYRYNSTMELWLCTGSAWVKIFEDIGTREEPTPFPLNSSYVQLFVPALL